MAAADWVESGISSSPVAIRIILTALPITSAGRFWPCGPLGTEASYTDELANRVEHSPADRTGFVGFVSCSLRPLLSGKHMGTKSATRYPVNRSVTIKL